MAATRALAHDLVRILEGQMRTDRQAVAWLPLAADPVNASRRGAPAHFTASALPITGDGTRVCLVLHSRIGLWLQPGGHLEGGDETVQEAARREMLEETGLEASPDPRPVKLSRHPAPCAPGRWHLDLQFVARLEERPPAVSPESDDVAWFPTDRLPSVIAPGVPELVRAAVARVRGSGLRSPSTPPA